jgi:hypothetical protein
MDFNMAKSELKAGWVTKVVTTLSLAAYSACRNRITELFPNPISPSIVVSPCRLLIVNLAFASVACNEEVRYRDVGLGEMKKGVSSVIRETSSIINWPYNHFCYESQDLISSGWIRIKLNSKPFNNTYKRSIPFAWLIDVPLDC